MGIRCQELWDASNYLDIPFIQSETNIKLNTVNLYPVVGSTQKTDNIIRQPQVLLIEGMVSNEVLKAKGLPFVGELKSIYQIDRNALNGVDVRVQFLERLAEFEKNALPLIIYSEIDIYYSFVIESCTINLHHSRVNAYSLVMQFKEIIVATKERVDPTNRSYSVSAYQSVYERGLGGFNV